MQGMRSMNSFKKLSVSLMRASWCDSAVYLPWRGSQRGIAHLKVRIKDTDLKR